MHTQRKRTRKRERESARETNCKSHRWIPPPILPPKLDRRIETSQPHFLPAIAVRRDIFGDGADSGSKHFRVEDEVGRGSGGKRGVDLAPS
jgi:hypothetical protein